MRRCRSLWRKKGEHGVEDGGVDGSGGVVVEVDRGVHGDRLEDSRSEIGTELRWNWGWSAFAARDSFCFAGRDWNSRFLSREERDWRSSWLPRPIEQQIPHAPLCGGSE